MAAESSRSSTSSADTYIGSLISLTSKSEIRYEGILYNINTEESSIGLRNVRSFGSEGRKKDGPQIMPSEKVYEYILFRGSDIKDLQVKTSPPVQPTQPINSDPAIIQSHYPRPTLTPPSLPSTGTTNFLSDQNTPTPQLGHQQQHPGIPLYQPDGSMGSWGPSPPQQNSTGLQMPMYWPGFYPQLHQQQSMFRPMQYPNFNSPLPGNPPNLPEYPSPLLPTSSTNLTASLPSTLPPVPPMVLSTEPLPSFLQNKPLNNPVITTTTPDVNVNLPPVSSVLSGANPVFYPSGTNSESLTPSLVTPGQLLQSGKEVVVSLTESTQVVVDNKDVGPTPILEPSVPVSVTTVNTEGQPPMLPLPTQPRNPPRMNGASYHNHSNNYNNYRGRERGRGSGGSRQVMKFTEEFDFTAMNEKFNKDEVWGTLGKTSSNGNVSDEDELLQDENNAVLPKFDVKPVYSKDDFFDTLSSNSNDRQQSNNGRARFSEQMKLDTETFGEFSRYRGGRGGRGPYRGGRGGYYGGRGYNSNYVNRGRGGRNPTRDY